MAQFEVETTIATLKNVIQFDLGGSKIDEISAENPDGSFTRADLWRLRGHNVVVHSWNKYNAILGRHVASTTRVECSPKVASVLTPWIDFVTTQNS